MIEYLQDFLDDDMASLWLKYFGRSGLDWVRESFRIFGQKMSVPRRLLWFGDKGLSYLGPTRIPPSSLMV